MADQLAPSWGRVLLVFWTFLWPTVLSVTIVAAYDGRRRGLVLGTYLLGLVTIVPIVLLLSPDLTGGQLLLYWTVINGPATLFVLAFRTRRIRAVGPLVLAFTTAVAVGSQAVLLAASCSERLLLAFVALGEAVGFGAKEVFASMVFAGMLAFGGLGWPLLLVLGQRYERRKFSDQSIVLDATWLVFAIVQSVGLVFQSPYWILTGAVAFGGYKLTTIVLFRRQRTDKLRNSPKALLLLRVFALGKQSERLFDRLRTHWQYAGNTLLIAGPDLVTTTAEPDEFLQFVGGRLSREFVADSQDLERRLGLVSRRPDPDGRYRVNEFFCRADTWQMTMERLAASADAVLMDLRRFSALSTGCVFELGRLLDNVELRRIVFLVDATTDMNFLETTLRELWSALAADSPNRVADTCSACLYSTTNQSGDEIHGLLKLLLPPSTVPAAVA